MKMLIGSAAIKHHFPDFPRNPKDLDYAVIELSEASSKDVEYLFNPIIFDYDSGKIASPEVLLSLKVSHIFWDINWEKHMWDIQFLLKKGITWNLEFIKDMREFWDRYLPKIHRSNLKMTREEFFSNAVNKNELEHDLLHEKLHPNPAYKQLLKNGCDVELGESKWDCISFSEKCRVVYEETAVMAYERYPKNMYWKKAFNRQLKDNIIKHFPFYIALFAVENFIELSNPKNNYQLKLSNHEN